MDKLLSSFAIRVPETIYLKDPESSELGQKIIKYSIELIDELGFEAFNFKKLGAQIGSNESSIYRYFESKHKLLVYLSSWYWSWLEYRVVMATFSLVDARAQLNRAVEIIAEEVKEDSNFTYVNEVALNRIIVSESSKSFLTKTVDEENKAGNFERYKNLVQRLVKMIEGACPDYPYAKSLSSTLVEASLHQHFLRVHFKSITDCHTSGPKDFLADLVKKTLS
jgi:AcrR family transcriptional regulator